MSLLIMPTGEEMRSIPKRQHIIEKLLQNAE